MKPKLLFLSTLAAGVATAFLLAPAETNAQAAAATQDDPALTAALVELQAEQTAIVANQAKIDEKLAVVAEDLRLARIFVSRGGRK